MFNRFILKGYKVLQTWEGLVYHFTSRGSRFNKHAGGAAGKNSDEWLYTTTKNMRNFIRKWGTPVKHDSLMKPIIPPKYNIGFILEGNDFNFLHTLEPWCDTIYIDSNLREDYIKKEQKHTIMDLHDRVKPYDNEKQNEILVEINPSIFNQQDFMYLQQLPEILRDNLILEDDFGSRFEVGNLKLTINNLNTYEKDLIKWKKQ